MADYDGAAIRYVDVALGKTDKPYLPGNKDSGYPRGRMFASGDSIFSYGNHFEIARAIRDKTGKVVYFLINGDTWGPTTGKQQSAVRNAIHRSGVPFVIIPHSAMDPAGIVKDSIQIVDVLPDRQIPRTDVRHTFPEGAVWQNDVIVDKRGDLVQRDRFGNVWVERFPDPDDWQSPVYYRLSYGSMQRELMRTLHRKDEQRRDKHEVTIGREDHIERRLYISKQAAKRGLNEFNQHLGPVWDVTVTDDGVTTYTRRWRQHLLGESLIRAQVNYTRIFRCTACKGSKRAPEPWRNEWAVTRWEQAHADWVEGHERWEADRLITLAKWKEERPDAGWIPRHLEFPAEAPIEPEWHTECQTCGGRGRLSEPARRWAYFLSGFDANEAPRISYFFCELPPARVKPVTVTEAYEVLKPESVKLAESMGRRVERQGDIFAIELATTTRSDLKKQAAVFSKGGYVFATNHKVTEVALLPDGTTIARGTLTHAPEGRRPDHKRLSLGKSWFVLAKNTVPLTK